MRRMVAVAADAPGVDAGRSTRNTSVAHAMTALALLTTAPTPAIAADELEAVVLALLDREAAESDVDRLTLLRRGRRRLERQLADLLSA